MVQSHELPKHKFKAQKKGHPNGDGPFRFLMPDKTAGQPFCTAPGLPAGRGPGKARVPKRQDWRFGQPQAAP